MVSSGIHPYYLSGEPHSKKLADSGNSYFNTGSVHKLLTPSEKGDSKQGDVQLQGFC